jgi:hypothetical protein
LSPSCFRAEYTSLYKVGSTQTLTLKSFDDQEWQRQAELNGVNLPLVILAQLTLCAVLTSSREIQPDCADLETYCANWYRATRRPGRRLLKGERK